MHLLARRAGSSQETAGRIRHQVRFLTLSGRFFISAGSKRLHAKEENRMKTNMFKGSVPKIYLRYLAAAFGSAMITSIYSLVDMAVIGQSQGPSGTAALAVVAPVWNIIYSLGLLAGVGGSVLFANAKGQAAHQKKAGESGANAFFSASLTGVLLLALIAWLGLIFFDTPLLCFFGADETLLPLAQQYLIPVKFTVPCFVLNQYLAAFLRNDSNPGLATGGVLAGGLLNVFGDIFFVFTLGMGMAGAGLATAAGSVLSTLVLCTHFLSRKNTLQLVRMPDLFFGWRQIVITGFSTFFIDIAMGILTILFNRQIQKYFGISELAVYGIIMNLATLVQCSAYAIGQAAQPLISINYGAGQNGRVFSTLRCAIVTSLLFGIVWTALAFLFPLQIAGFFMRPDPGVLAAAPLMMRLYSLSFLLLPLNIFSTYYFQALLRPAISMAVSVGRGLLISGFIILLLPAVLVPGTLWLAMPLTELAVCLFVLCMMAKTNRQLRQSTAAKNSCLQPQA